MKLYRFWCKVDIIYPVCEFGGGGGQFNFKGAEGELDLQTAKVNWSTTLRRHGYHYILYLSTVIKSFLSSYHAIASWTSHLSYLDLKLQCLNILQVQISSEMQLAVDSTCTKLLFYRMLCIQNNLQGWLIEYLCKLSSQSSMGILSQ